jgi:hypothetical protein
MIAALLCPAWAMPVIANSERFEQVSEQQEPPTQPDEAQPDEAQPDEEARWPTNGGPLGCFLGVCSGVLIGAFLGTTLLIPFRVVAIILTICLTVGFAVLGWKLGRRFFREYPASKR